MESISKLCKPFNMLELDLKNYVVLHKHSCVCVSTYSLAIGLIEGTLLFNLGQFHIHLLTDNSHRVST